MLFFSQPVAPKATPSPFAKPTPKTSVCGCAIAYALQNISKPAKRVKYAKGLKKLTGTCLHEYDHPHNAYRKHTKDDAYSMVVDPLFHRIQDLRKAEFASNLIWFTIEQRILVRGGKERTPEQVARDMKGAITSRLGLSRKYAEVYETEVGPTIPDYRSCPAHRNHRMVVGVPQTHLAGIKLFISTGNFERVALVHDSMEIVMWSKSLEVRERPSLPYSHYRDAAAAIEAKQAAVTEAANKRAKRKAEEAADDEAHDGITTRFFARNAVAKYPTEMLERALKGHLVPDLLHKTTISLLDPDLKRALVEELERRKENGEGAKRQKVEA